MQKRLQSLLVARHGVVLEVPPHHRLQPLQRSADVLVHPLLQLLPNFLQFGCHTFADRSPTYREIALRLARPTDVGETQKVKGLRLPFPTLRPALSGISPKLNQACLLRMQLQPEFPHALPQLLQESLSVFPVLETQHSVIRIAHDDHFAPGYLLPPCHHPQIEYIVQVEVGKDRRNHRTLRSPFLRLEPPAVFHHARLQPFLDQAHDPLICDPMLDELHQPLPAAVHGGLIAHRFLHPTRQPFGHGQLRGLLVEEWKRLLVEEWKRLLVEEWKRLLVLAHGVSMRAWGLGARTGKRSWRKNWKARFDSAGHGALALARTALLPSGLADTVGSLICRFRS